MTDSANNIVPLSGNRPEAVFFDWDGTLVDTLPFLLKAHNHVRETLGYPLWDVDDFKRHVHYSSRELYGTLYGDQETYALETLARFMEENHLAHLTVLSDSYDLLAYLAGEGIPVGIVSNKRHEFLLREISHLGWDHLARISIGAGFAGKDKPAPDPLLLALKSCDIVPSANVWYVGDSETDMRTAAASGCAAVLVRHHHDNEHLQEQYNPLHVFDNCKKLHDFIAQPPQSLAKKA